VKRTADASVVLKFIPADRRIFPFNKICPEPDGLSSMFPVPEVLLIRFWFISALTTTLFEISVCKTFCPFT